jgi:hypothetical protein
MNRFIRIAAAGMQIGHEGFYDFAGNLTVAISPRSPLTMAIKLPRLVAGRHKNYYSDREPGRRLDLWWWTGQPGCTRLH